MSKPLDVGRRGGDCWPKDEPAGPDPNPFWRVLVASFGVGARPAVRGVDGRPRFGSGVRGAIGPAGGVKPVDADPERPGELAAPGRAPKSFRKPKAGPDSWARIDKDVEGRNPSGADPLSRREEISSRASPDAPVPRISLHSFVVLSSDGASEFALPGARRSFMSRSLETWSPTGRPSLSTD